MKSKLLVINGQHLNLSKAGGAGQYARQLYKRLIDPKRAVDFVGLDVFFENFQKVLEVHAPVSAPVKQSSDMLKHAVHRCCPPIIFDRLQQMYQHVSQDSKPASFGTAAPWMVASGASTTLLHELTNYTMINEIGRLSLSPKFILAVTFLDIQDYYYPEYFIDKTLCYRRLAYTFYKDRAECFFAISEFTKQTMVDRLDINPENIKVTHLAADDLLILDPSDEIIDWVNSLGRYWIYPAKAWKHKNHDFLLKSFGKRKDELKRAGVKLLLTGSFNDDDTLRLVKLISDNDLLDIVKILGFVSDEQLQTLLKGADFLVFPSLFEGFGMPILEAMTLGCPVLSSNAGSLPEVGGDAAMYFDPTCEEEFVALIDSALTRSGVDRDSMIKKGFENSKRFSWEKTYRETLEVYKKLL